MDDPETYEAALERQRTRPRPNPAVRYTGRPIMTMIAEALGPVTDLTKDDTDGADL
jgi:hypothetical protein